jgi:methylated-DNA-[protein]-cysteine S-methyltransferase
MLFFLKGIKMLYKTIYPSPLGKLHIVSDGKSIVGLWMDGQKYFESTIKEELIYNENLTIFNQAYSWLDRYFKGLKPNPDELPLAPQGSEFRKEVWGILLTIPYGKTMAYGEIAKIIAKKRHIKNMSAQAVGGAVGHNPISIIIPCHRVIGANGELTGYAGGIDKKIQLLQLEGKVVEDGMVY